MEPITDFSNNSMQAINRHTPDSAQLLQTDRQTDRQTKTHS